MPEERDDLDEPEEREEPKAEGLGPKGEKALKEERKARKEAEERAERVEAALRTERFGRLKGQHSWLEESDLEGVDLDKWESRVSRLAAIAGAGGQPLEEPKAEEIPADAKERIQAFTQTAGGSGSAVAKTYTPSEVQEIGLRNQAEALRIIQSGAMQSPDK